MALSPQASARRAGRQAGRQRLLSVVPAPTPTPTPVPSPALLPKSPGLTFARSGGGEVRTIHSAGPRSIAPFKCRKLSGQVGAFDFASSFSLTNGFFFFLSPISPTLRLPPPNCREGRRERGKDGRRMCEKQAFFPGKRSPLLFLTQETPLHHLRIMDTRESRRLHLRSSSAGGQKGGPVCPSCAGRFLSHLNSK